MHVVRESGLGWNGFGVRLKSSLLMNAVHGGLEQIKLYLLQSFLYF